MSRTQRQVSPLAATLLIVVALVGGGLAAYLLYDNSGPTGPQLVATAPLAEPATLPSSPAPGVEPAAPSDSPAPAASAGPPAASSDDIAESDVHPQVQQQGLALVEAVVEQYEAAWPWVRQAWERSDVRFYDQRLPAPCDRAGVVGCVRGDQLLLTLQGVQNEETVLHELGHVWNNTAAADWAPIQDAFSEHYAGCYSRRAPTPERLQEELLIDAMVIASGATLGDFSLGGFGYYEDGLWNDGFAGCLVDAAEPAPHLLTAIRTELFNCRFDGEAAQAAARAKADDESGSSIRLFRSAEEQQASAWAALVPRLCADTAHVQRRTLQALEAVVASHEVPWPWLRTAWEASDIQFVDDLTEVCPPNSNFPLGSTLNDWNPPTVACVHGTQILFALLAVQTDEARLAEPLLQALARVWNNTAGVEWTPIRDAFAAHYAGCHNDQLPTPEQLQEALIADTMLLATSAIDDYAYQGTGYQPGTGSTPFPGCDAPRDDPPEELLNAVTTTLFHCPYDDDAARNAWVTAGGNPDSWEWSLTGRSLSQDWQNLAEDVCGADA